jgi:hypothetical protein
MSNAGQSPSLIFRVALAAALVGAIWGAAPAPADAQGTPEQQQACSGDAQRLCGQFIPDIPKITACMKQKRVQLSPACRAAMGPPPKGRKHVTHHQT